MCTPVLFNMYEFRNFISLELQMLVSVNKKTSDACQLDKNTCNIFVVVYTAKHLQKIQPVDSFLLWYEFYHFLDSYRQ